MKSPAKIKSDFEAPKFEGIVFAGGEAVLMPNSSVFGKLQAFAFRLNAFSQHVDKCL